MNDAARAFEAGLWTEALRLTEAAMQRQESAEAWLCKARCLHHLHRHGEAATAAGIACDRWPDNGRIVALAANVLDCAGYSDVARKCLTRALKTPNETAFCALWAMGKSYRYDWLLFESRIWLKAAKEAAPESIKRAIQDDYIDVLSKLN
jgi:tetratricopeptide (TPR) repeat protein